MLMLENQPEIMMGCRVGILLDSGILFRITLVEVQLEQEKLLLPMMKLVE